MAKKSPNTTGTPKPRKARTAIEKVFVVTSASGSRLVAGVNKRKVEAAVWQRPVVRVATPTDLRELTAKGVLIEALPGEQARIDIPAEQPQNSTDSGAEAGAA